MTARDHERYVEDLAPYALGALSPLEAEALEKHLRTCGDCLRELAELRTGVEALARSVEQVDPQPSLRARLIEEVAAESAPEGSPPPEPATAPAARSAVAEDDVRGRRDWGGALRRALARGRARGPALRPRPAAVLATALVAAVTGAAGWALGDAGGEERRTVAATVDRDRLPNASARLRVSTEGKDPVLHMEGLRNLGPQRSYELWVQRDGEISPGPLFSPTADGDAVAGVPNGVEGIDALYVTRERAGGARTPSESPIVRVAVPSQ